ncbi:hypothetical protein BC938DRAFT_471856 [Jimgerdemannia flammicorona]|uniref:Uncharacterized protein n=1 Tax=Jimgerdemannia flammicorona TaxID=994334 RepID=A0A433Q764_9FUNG|nr:hypothetical protein BC938DRAFT_471856 [Jimgerdemannia flammicorona]
MARVRAIEQGFAMLRCDSGGVSGFVDDVGRVRHWQEAEVGGAGSHSFVVDVKLQQTKLYTWYGSMGDWPFVGALLVLFGRWIGAP